MKSRTFTDRWRVRRIDRVKRKFGRLVVAENGPQRPLLEVGANDEGGQQDDAAPPHCGVSEHLAVVRAQRPGDRHPVIAVATSELPLVSGGEMPVGQAIVFAQIIGMHRRAALLEIGRRGAHDAIYRHDLACDQAR